MSPPAAAVPEVPRPYLKADDRRAQILDAAAVIAGRDGLAALTMAGVASEAGVSRQWVHEHFGDLAGLYRALLFDRFAALDARIDAEGPPTSGAGFARFVARGVIDAAPADRRILRAAVDGGLRDELAPVEEEVRTRIFGRWLPLVRPGCRDDAEARAVVQAAVGAVFSLADQAGRDGLDPDRAEELIGPLIAAIADRRGITDRSVRRARRSRAV